MRIAKSIAAAAVLTLISSGAWAEQIQGKITKLDKASHQVTIQRGAPGETVGTASAKTEQFLLKHDPSFDALKVGDQVTLKVEDVNGERQITHYDK